MEQKGQDKEDTQGHPESTPPPIHIEMKAKITLSEKKNGISKMPFVVDKGEIRTHALSDHGEGCQG